MLFSNFENTLLGSNKIIIGIDEAGRGCLFGPLALGSVVLKARITDYRVKDSKKMLETTRIKVFNEWSTQIPWKVAYSQPKTGLNQAYEDCVQQILDFIEERRYKDPVILMDNGIKRFFKTTPYTYEFKQGDNKCFSIALASIFAKVSRDNYVTHLSKQKKYSYYDIENNKGYTAETHYKGLREHGVSDLHRKFYSNIKEFL